MIKRLRKNSDEFNENTIEQNSKETSEKKDMKKIVLVGSPNVGKSLLFNELTGIYVTVSNYPGTTVSIDRGKCNIGGENFEVIDSPGMYSLSSITEEERISKLTLLEEKPDILIHVVDAKNIPRMLPLTLQLIEADLPVILALNMIDEAEKVGIKINKDKLEKGLKIPVVTTAAISGEGIAELRKKIGEYRKKEGFKVNYDEKLESAINEISTIMMGNNYPLSKRSLSLLLLQQDEDVKKLIEDEEGANYKNIDKLLNEITFKFRQPLNYLVKMKLQREASDLVSSGLYDPGVKISFREKLSRAMIRPITGIPLLILILYYGLFKFVGEFGAGELVDFIESVIFGEWINPGITDFVVNTIPYVPIQELFVGEYGILTLGVTYGVAIILPIVGPFFLVFSILEDSGYLPRLALLLDRAFKKIGLSGRAIIPMVLGLGCGSMATMATRTLETEREKTIATLLLALTIPCAAQMGVIFAILAEYPNAMWIWMLVILLNYVLIGFAASKIFPGEEPKFYMELPPLRFPKISNVLKKTYTRLIWYFRELFPLFIVISVLIWVLQLTGILDLIIALITPVVHAIGLPIESSKAFILGFFRRDFGAAGLYDIQAALTGVQLLVSAVVLTLFLPCVAQFMVMTKERGIKMSLLIAVFVLSFAFLVGFILNLILTSLGVVL